MGLAKVAGVRTGAQILSSAKRHRLALNMRPSVLPVAAFSACLLFAGCASNKQAHPDAWTQDKTLVLQSINALQTDQSKFVKNMQAMQGKLAELKTTHTQSNAAYAAQQEEILKLKQQISKLQLAMRRLKSATSLLKKARRISKKKLDKKIEKIAMAIKPQAIKSAEPADQNIAAEKEKDHYTAAYLALKSGRYEEAITKFRTLLKAYPKGQYSDQAYYWLGESYLALNNVGRAIGNMEWLVSHYPESTKHAATMLKLGLAYKSQERFEDAKDVWRKLIRLHGDTPAAERAGALLASLDSKK